MKKSKVFSELDRLCRDEIMLMDGPLGTMVQKHKLQEEDYRGDLLKNHSLDLKGNNEILNITRPNIIKEIHKSYINSGSKIIETNTFGATSIAQSDYKLEHLVEKMNIESVKVAKVVKVLPFPFCYFLFCSSIGCPVARRGRAPPRPLGSRAWSSRPEDGGRSGRLSPETYSIR